MAIIHDNVQKNFLELFRDPLFVNISERPGVKKDVRHTTDLDSALALNSEDKSFGAYFSVNGFADFDKNHNRETRSVTSLNAHFIDIDDTARSPRAVATEVTRAAEHYGIPVSAVVLTGRGVHCYWLLGNPLIQPSEDQKQTYRGIQDTLVHLFGGDAQARDIPRVMRIPGSRYWKDGSGKQIELITLTDKRYVEGDFFKLVSAHEQSHSAYPTTMSEVHHAKHGERHGKSYRLALGICNQLRDPQMHEEAHLTYRAIVDKNYERVSGDGFHDKGGEADKQFEAAWQKIQTRSMRKSWAGLHSSTSSASVPVFTSFDNITAKQIQWLWPERIALGKVTLLVGDPSAGKSLLTTALAAVVSNGGDWPVDHTSSPTGDVIMLSAEDDAADTIKNLS